MGERGRDNRAPGPIAWSQRDELRISWVDHWRREAAADHEEAKAWRGRVVYWQEKVRLAQAEVAAAQEGLERAQRERARLVERPEEEA